LINDFRRRDLAQYPFADPAPVATWPDSAPLSFIDFPASSALPGVRGKCPDRLVEPVPDRDAEPIAVHGRHLVGKVRSVVRSSLEDIELPLVNHLVRQRADDLPFSLLGIL